MAYSTSNKVAGRIRTVEEREEGLLVSIDMFPDAFLTYVWDYRERMEKEREEIVDSTPITD